VALMAAVALTAVFIHETNLPNVGGFGPIRLLAVVTAVALPQLVVRARRLQVAADRRIAVRLFAGALLLAGAFTLLPSRRLGHLPWGALGLVG
jgi:uncharacterized membrane protein